MGQIAELRIELCFFSVLNELCALEFPYRNQLVFPFQDMRFGVSRAAKSRPRFGKLAQEFAS